MAPEAMFGAEDQALFGRKRRGKRAAKAPIATETGLQISIISRLAFHGIVCVHIKNERKQSIAAGRAMKKAGVLPGMTDLVALQGDRRAAFLEIKRPGWKPPGPDAKGEGAQHYRRQCEVHDMLRRLGFWAGFVTSQDEAVAALREAGFKC